MNHGHATVEFWSIRENPPELLGTVTLELEPTPHLVVTGLEWVHEIAARPAFDVAPAPTEEFLTALEAAYQGTALIGRLVKATMAQRGHPVYALDDLNTATTDEGLVLVRNSGGEVVGLLGGEHHIDRSRAGITTGEKVRARADALLASVEAKRKADPALRSLRAAAVAHLREQHGADWRDLDDDERERLTHNLVRRLTNARKRQRESQDNR